MGISTHLINLIRTLYEDQEASGLSMETLNGLERALEQDASNHPIY